MKNILDSDFHYRPSFDTDVRRTFEKVRRQQQAKERQERAGDEPRIRILKLDQLKKASGS
jgi:hypothetical protein